VNFLGFYRGGVPQKGRGAIRGAAIARPGEFHTPQYHNFLNNQHPDATLVSSEDAIKFKAYMQVDKVDYTMSRPSHPMHYDHSMDFMKDRSFWLMLILSMLGGMYFVKKVYYERMRWQRWERMQNIENMPAHHFNNRGGVLVQK